MASETQSLRSVRGIWRDRRRAGQITRALRKYGSFTPKPCRVSHPDQSKMDINKLVEVLRATLQPDQREQAEQQLQEVGVFAALVQYGFLAINNNCD